MLGSLRDPGLIDAVVAVLAPRLIGGSSAPGAIGGGGAATLAEAIAAELTSRWRRSAAI